MTDNINAYNKLNVLTIYINWELVEGAFRRNKSGHQQDMISNL